MCSISNVNMKLQFFFTIVVIYFTSHFSLAEKHNRSIHYDDDGLDLIENVQFFLYTRKNKNNAEKLYVNDKNSLKNSAYNVTLPTKFVTHGWNATYLSDSCATVVRAFLTHDSYNAIAIDWGAVASQKYYDAASRVRVIGNYVGKMVAFLRDQGSSLTFMSLVGHSMGAHIVGFAGKNLPDKGGNKVGHIVGLDPAGVSFDDLGPSDRLARDDAENVQVIHTNMGQKGTSIYVGETDFYPNGGGPHQPGCPDDDGGRCAHTRSYMYYAESLQNPNKWYCVQCESYDDLNKGKCLRNDIKPFPRWSGDFRAKHAKYMLRTNSTSPYGLGFDGTQPAK